MAEAEGAMFQHLDIMEKDLLHRLNSDGAEDGKTEVYAHPLLTELDPEKKKTSEGTR